MITPHVATKKGPTGPSFVLKPILLSAPGLNNVRAEFSFPFLELAMVPALGLDQLARIWVLVDLDVTCFADTFRGSGSRSTACCLGIEESDDVAEAITVLGKQSPQLSFEFNFFFQAFVAFHGFKGSELFGQVFFELTELSKTGHEMTFIK
ncbi:hypothetical protein A7K61_19165 [Pseudomonas sp. AP42]|nr:hypothetical protein A7K61_19165 [Pseudomonas sp. AP42]